MYDWGPLEQSHFIRLQGAPAPPTELHQSDVDMTGGSVEPNGPNAHVGANLFKQ